MVLHVVLLHTGEAEPTIRRYTAYSSRQDSSWRIRHPRTGDAPLPRIDHREIG